VQDDLGVLVEHLLVAAGVVAVMMRVEDVADRLIGDALHLGDDLRIIALEFVVHQDHAFGRRVDGDVAAVAHDHVQVVGNFLDRQVGGRLLLR
jgi:hypothetical protein